MLGYLNVVRENIMDRNLIMHCYYDVSTSLKENKPLVEVTEKLQALADKYKMSLLDLTEIALEAGYYKSQIPEEDLKKYRDTIKKIRKPLLAVRREQLKGKKIINPQVEDLKTTREKMYLYNPRVKSRRHRYRKGKYKKGRAVRRSFENEQ